MLKAIIILLVLYVTTTKSFGQSDSIKASSIDKYSYQLDTSNIKIDSLNLVIDSIEIEVMKSGDKIITKNHFTKSNTTLTITYFLKAKKIVLINIVEPSKKMKKMYRFSYLYYENDFIIHETHRRTWPSGLAISIEDLSSNIFGYNESFTIEFLKFYVMKLYKKICNYS